MSSSTQRSIKREGILSLFDLRADSGTCQARQALEIGASEAFVGRACPPPSSPHHQTDKTERRSRAEYADHCHHDASDTALGAIYGAHTQSRVPSAIEQPATRDRFAAARPVPEQTALRHALALAERCTNAGTARGMTALSSADGRSNAGSRQDTACAY